MREVRLQWLRPDEITAEKERVSVVYLPIGPLEWHGPHLPIGTDPLQAEQTALQLAQKLGGVVHPTLFLGTERERSPELLKDLGFKGDEWIVGMDFPENSMLSYYYSEDAFAVIVRFTLEQLAAQGYRNIVIVNGHGATNQISQLKRLALEFSRRGLASVLYTFDLDSIQGEDAGHATVTETAAVMALDEARVNLANLPSQDIPLLNTAFAIVDEKTFSGQPNASHTVQAQADPRLATKEMGQTHYAAIIEKLSRQILELLK